MKVVYLWIIIGAPTLLTAGEPAVYWELVILLAYSLEPSANEAISGLQATFQTERVRLGRLGRRPESGDVEVEGAMITVIDNLVLDRRCSSCIRTMGEEAQRQVMA